MAWQQLVSPNLSVNGKAGYCLWLQEEAYGTPHLYDDAEDQDPNRPDAWSAAQYKHPGELPPPNMYCLVYWTFYNQQDGIEEGHIATSLGDGRVFSSPMDRNFGNQTFNSIDEVTNRINKIADANSQYLGWSEDLAGVRIVQLMEEPEMIGTRDNAIRLWRMLRPNMEPSEDDINAIVGQSLSGWLPQADAEVVARNQNLAAQATLITQLQQVDKDDQVRIAALTEQLATIQATMTDVQKATVTAAKQAPVATKAPWYIRLLATLQKKP